MQVTAAITATASVTRAAGETTTVAFPCCSALDRGVHDLLVFVAIAVAVVSLLLLLLLLLIVDSSC